MKCERCGTKAQLAPADPLGTTAPIQAKVEDDTHESLAEAVLEFLNEQALEAPPYLEKLLKGNEK